MPEYDADYYLNGPATGKSNYQNYSWMPDLTLPMADHLRRCLHIGDLDDVLDVGCARGYLVKALRMRGVRAFGYDTSKWAIDNCDDGVRSYVFNHMPEGQWDHVVMKDVAEHIPEGNLKTLIVNLLRAARKNLLLIVPLTKEIGYPYLREEDNSDPSHVIRWPLEVWMDFLLPLVPEGFVLTGSWHYPGLKPASSQTPKSCGFLRIHRA